MKRIETKIIYINAGEHMSDIQNKLNIEGTYGWELKVAQECMQEGVYYNAYILQREIPRKFLTDPSSYWPFKTSNVS